MKAEICRQPSPTQKGWNIIRESGNRGVRKYEDDHYEEGLRSFPSRNPSFKTVVDPVRIQSHVPLDKLPASAF